MAVIKAVAYLRVSSKGQEAGSGFDRQLSTILNFCRANNLSIEKVYKESISGVKDENERPEFALMISGALLSGINVVIIESMDRLARQYIVSEQIAMYLASKGIDLFSANTGENITEAMKSDPWRKATIRFQGLVAELERDLILLRLRKGREKKRQDTGKCGGAQRYGELPEEKEVLKRIAYWRRRMHGNPPMSYEKIAQRLNSEYIPTKTGRKWTAQLVAHMMRRGKQKKGKIDG